jgi:hypothetical protein
MHPLKAPRCTRLVEIHTCKGHSAYHLADFPRAVGAFTPDVPPCGRDDPAYKKACPALQRRLADHVTQDKVLLAATRMADRGRAPEQTFPENLRGTQLGSEIRGRVQQSGHSGHVHMSVNQARKNRLALNINDTALLWEGDVGRRPHGCENRTLYEYRGGVQCGTPRTIHNPSVFLFLPAARLLPNGPLRNLPDQVAIFIM